MLAYNEALSWLFAQTRSGAPRSLERMRLLWSTLDLSSPKNCIYVVGTNGKGSVSHMLAEGLSAEGYKTGLFISPHVSNFRERISVNGVQISEVQVSTFIERIKTLDLNPKPAFFEWTFALALTTFKDLDFAVIESGVGARLDATNLIQNVGAVVITNVALDHQNSLGHTLIEIATDKAEAIREKTPSFTTATDEALEVIKQVAKQKQSHLIIVQQEQTHLKSNQALVKQVLETLELSKKSILEAQNAKPLAARLEHFCIKNRTVILDGAHNAHAARALVASLNSPYHLIFAAHERKNASGLLEILGNKAVTIIVTKLEGQDSTKSPFKVIDTPLDALNHTLELADDLPLVIAGSFYLAGELRPELLRLSKF